MHWFFRPVCIAFHVIVTKDSYCTDLGLKLLVVLLPSSMPQDSEPRLVAQSFIDKLASTLSSPQNGSEPVAWKEGQLVAELGHDCTLRPYGVIRQIQQTFNRIPALRQQIALPQNDEERLMAKRFKSALRQLVGQYIYETHIRDILQKGHVSVSQLKKMHNIDRYCNPSGDYSAFLDDLRWISEAEKALLLRDSEYFSLVLGFMDQRNQQAAVAAVSQAIESSSPDSSFAPA
jgi:hypothetical protein